MEYCIFAIIGLGYRKGEVVKSQQRYDRRNASSLVAEWAVTRWKRACSCSFSGETSSWTRLTCKAERLGFVDEMCSD